VGSEGRRRLDELEFRAWRALVYAYSAVVPKLDEELANAQGVSLNQFEILTLLAQARKRGLRMSDLASQVVLSPSGLTRAVDQLERKGLVTRCVFEDDKRGHLAAITGEGRARLRKATNAHVPGIREHFLKYLSRRELECLANSLEAVLSGQALRRDLTP